MRRVAPPSTVAAVVLSVLLLIGMNVQLAHLHRDGQADVYHARVQEAAAHRPNQIGVWKARDAPLPEAAVALLKPNVLLSQRFVHDQSGQSFAFLLVQCADARDMAGHYPPNCYPNAGWRLGERRPIRLPVSGTEVAGMEYVFSRLTQQGPEEVKVRNFIMMPRGEFAGGMSDVYDQIDTFSDRYFGAGQIQLVFDPSWSEDQRHEITIEVLTALWPIVDTVLHGRQKLEGADAVAASGVAD